MSETITLIDTSDPRATEGMRQMMRKLYLDPKNVAFRRACRSAVQAQNFAFMIKGGEDPLPEVLDPPMCTCGEHVAEDVYNGRCYTCWENDELEDSEGPDA